MYICNMETKKCKSCNEVKLVDQYNKGRQYKNKQYYQSYCKPCQNKKNVKWQSDRYKNDNEFKTYKKTKCVEYQKARKKADPLFKMICVIRARVSMAITQQGYSKNSSTYEMLGCTFEEFKTHIESQFVDGMNWDNQGEWHYDHIKPISLANTEAEAIALNHYTNFQPLWAEDNLRKSNKY